MGGGNRHEHETQRDTLQRLRRSRTWPLCRPGGAARTHGTYSTHHTRNACVHQHVRLLRSNVQVPQATSAEMVQAVDAASEAFKTWSKVSGDEYAHNAMYSMSQHRVAQERANLDFPHLNSIGAAKSHAQVPASHSSAHTRARRNHHSRAG